MSEFDTNEAELSKLYNERSNLILAYQEMAEAARRLQNGFEWTIKENRLRLMYHRSPFQFYENTEKKCNVLLKDIL